MEINNINLSIGGAAGAGVMESGQIIAKAALRSGLFAFISHEYPSLIRGGHNFTSVRLSSEPVFASSAKINLLIALNQETIKLHESALWPSSGVIYDSDLIESAEFDQSGYLSYGVPLKTIAKEAGGPDLIRNTAALGAAFAAMHADIEQLMSVLRDTFAIKGEKIIEANIAAARKGYEHIKSKEQPKLFNYTLQSRARDKSLFQITGNDAMCLGALQAGVKFITVYPMTPITSMQTFLAANAEKYNLIVHEPEDEIAAINMIVGAGYAGTRALTATSGGGFCLMTEGISLAGMAEVPAVIVEGMRSGPSTSMPTQTEQSDLRFVLHAGHGEFPRIVVAPGDPAECFTEMFNAFNLAEKYQLPVIILTDKHLGNSLYTTTLPDITSWSVDRGKIVETSDTSEYPRFSLTDTGVSPRPLPGQPYFSKSTSYEHDIYGQPADDSATRRDMMHKRMIKMKTLAADLPEPILYGPAEASITLIGWGSTKGSILEALDLLAKENITANFLQLLYVTPFPAYAVSTIIDRSCQALLIEGNYTGQMAGYIREMTGRSINQLLLKYDGHPIEAEEIVAKVKEILQTSEVQSSNPSPSSEEVSHE